MWIDADAVVLRQSLRIEDILAQLPARAELVVGEDLTRNCLLNAGVLLVRVSAWSAALWADVWECERRWWDTPKHEQSALLKALKARHEGLRQVVPFHSYAGGPALKVRLLLVVQPHPNGTSACDRAY